MSRDLAYAKVYVTFLTTKMKTRLKRASKRCRKLLVHPQPAGESDAPAYRAGTDLLYDNSLVEGMRMSNLVTSVVNMTKNVVLTRTTARRTNESSRRRGRDINGVLLLDKPQGMSAMMRCKK